MECTSGGGFPYSKKQTFVVPALNVFVFVLLCRFVVQVSLASVMEAEWHYSPILTAVHL